MDRIKIPVGVKIFVGIWLVALCLPTVRELPKSHTFYEMFNGQNELNLPSGREFARRYPDDSTAALWAAEDDWRGYPADLDPDAAFNAGDKTALRKVAARFPDDLQIRALQVRTFAESLSDLKTVRDRNDLALRPQWAEAAQVAARGAQLEPENAFWPWMEASFLFAARRDADAFAAFERIANCEFFDDYSNANFKARLAFWERAANPSWEQKIALWSSTLFPQLSPMRQSATLVSQRAAQLRKTGAIPRAFALEGAVLKGAGLARRNEDVMITALVAEDIAAKSIREFADVERPKEGVSLPETDSYYDKLSLIWSDLARRNGQDALASRADWIRGPSVRTLYSVDDMDMTVQIFGISAPWVIVGVVLPLVLQTIGLVIAAGALCWLATGWLKFEGASPTRGQVALCANFSLWLLVAGAAASAFVAPKDFGLISGDGETTFTFLAVSFAIAALFCWLLPIGFVGLRNNRQLTRFRPANPRPLPPPWNIAHSVAWLIFSVALLVTFTSGRGLWDGTWFAISNAALVANASLLAALLLEFVRWQRGGWRFRLTRRETAPNAATPIHSSARQRLAPFGLWLLCGVFLAPVAMNAVSDAPFSQSLLPFALGVLAAAGALFSSWRLSRDHFKWQLARRSAGALLLSWSLLFLLLALAAWPLRAQLNQVLERRIALGEIAWMREQIEKPK